MNPMHFLFNIIRFKLGKAVEVRRWRWKRRSSSSQQVVIREFLGQIGVEIRNSKLREMKMTKNWTILVWPNLGAVR